MFGGYAGLGISGSRTRFSRKKNHVTATCHVDKGMLCNILRERGKKLRRKNSDSIFIVVWQVKLAGFSFIFEFSVNHLNRLV